MATTSNERSGRSSPVRRRTRRLAVGLVGVTSLASALVVGGALPAAASDSPSQCSPSTPTPGQTVTCTYGPGTDTATPPTAGAITASAGGGGSAQPGTAFSQPLVATVTDPTRSNAAVPNAAVTFKVTTGAATFADGQSTTTVNTDATGKAGAPQVAGSTPGPVTVTATVPGVATPATFAETVARPAPSQVSGTAVVIDGSQATTLSLSISSTGTSASGTCTLTFGATVLQCKTVVGYTRIGNTVTFSGTASPPVGPAVAYTATVTDGADPDGAGRDSFTVTAGGQTYSGTLTVGNLTIS